MTDPVDSAANKAMARRSLLRFGLGAAALCPLCIAAADRQTATAAEAHAAPHWGYEGAGGPEHWGELAPEYRV